MKRKLMLILAILAISVPSFGFITEAGPRDSSRQESSMQNADKPEKKKHKKEKKDKKEKKQPKEQESGTDFSIYG